MNKLRIADLEGCLVQIQSYDGYTIIDTYQLDKKSGVLFLESHDVNIYDDEVVSIFAVNDDLPYSYYKKGYAALIDSKWLH